jgi:hypothetical protein
MYCAAETHQKAKGDFAQGRHRPVPLNPKFLHSLADDK